VAIAFARDPDMMSPWAIDVALGDAIRWLSSHESGGFTRCSKFLLADRDC
jgi:hypothetical protein